MNINQIIQVNVNTSNTSAQLEDLGLPLIIGNYTLFPVSFTDNERVRSYNSISEVLADGFQENTILYKICQTVFSNGISKILIGKKISSDNSYFDAFTAINLKNSDFYAILIDSVLESDILNIATNIESLEKIFLACSTDTSILDTSITNDIASQLKGLSITRTQLFYDPNSLLASAVCGKLLSTIVGKDRIAYLSNLKNITAVLLSSNEISTLQNKNCSFYTTVAAIPLVISNTSSISTQLSSIRDIDWFKNQIQISILNYLANNKLPFSNAGIAIVENIIIQVIVQAMNYGVLSFATQAEIANKLGIAENQVQGYITGIGCSLIMPDLSSVSSSDLAQGILNNIAINALYSGVILSIKINAQV